MKKIRVGVIGIGDISDVYLNTSYDITTSRLDFSGWKRMKNLA